MGTLRSIVVLLLVGLTACTPPNSLATAEITPAPLETGVARPVRTGSTTNLPPQTLLPTVTDSLPLSPQATLPAYPEPYHPELLPSGYAGPYPTATITPTPYPLPLVSELPLDWLWFINIAVPICQKTAYAEGPDRTVVELTDALASYVIRADMPPLLLACEPGTDIVRLVDFTNDTSILLQLDLAPNEYEFEWMGPIISPDGTQIAFVNRPRQDATDYSGALYIADIATGKVEMVFEFPEVGSEANLVGWDYYGVIAWRTDGLYYLAAEESTDQWKIWRATWNPDSPASMPYNVQDGTLMLEEYLDVEEDRPMLERVLERGREYFTDPLPPVIPSKCRGLSTSPEAMAGTTNRSGRLRRVF